MSSSQSGHSNSNNPIPTTSSPSLDIPPPASTRADTALILSVLQKNLLYQRFLHTQLAKVNELTEVNDEKKRSISRLIQHVSTSSTNGQLHRAMMNSQSIPQRTIFAAPWFVDDYGFQPHGNGDSEQFINSLKNLALYPNYIAISKRKPLTPYHYYTNPATPIGLINPPQIWELDDASRSMVSATKIALSQYSAIPSQIIPKMEFFSPKFTPVQFLSLWRAVVIASCEFHSQQLRRLELYWDQVMDWKRQGVIQSMVIELSNYHQPTSPPLSAPLDRSQIHPSILQSPLAALQTTTPWPDLVESFFKLQAEHESGAPASPELNHTYTVLLSLSQLNPSFDPTQPPLHPYFFLDLESVIESLPQELLESCSKNNESESDAGDDLQDIDQDLEFTLPNPVQIHEFLTGVPFLHSLGLDSQTLAGPNPGSPNVNINNSSYSDNNNIYLTSPHFRLGKAFYDPLSSSDALHLIATMRYSNLLDGELNPIITSFASCLPPSPQHSAPLLNSLTNPLSIPQLFQYVPMGWLTANFARTTYQHYFSFYHMDQFTLSQTHHINTIAERKALYQTQTNERPYYNPELDPITPLEQVSPPPMPFLVSFATFKEANISTWGKFPREPTEDMSYHLNDVHDKTSRLWGELFGPDGLAVDLVAATQATTTNHQPYPYDMIPFQYLNFSYIAQHIVRNGSNGVGCYAHTMNHREPYINEPILVTLCLYFYWFYEHHLATKYFTVLNGHAPIHNDSVSAHNETSSANKGKNAIQPPTVELGELYQGDLARVLSDEDLIKVLLCETDLQRYVILTQLPIASPKTVLGDLLAVDYRITPCFKTIFDLYRRAVELVQRLSQTKQYLFRYLFSQTPVTLAWSNPKGKLFGSTTTTNHIIRYMDTSITIRPPLFVEMGKLRAAKRAAAADGQIDLALAADKEENASQGPSNPIAQEAGKVQPLDPSKEQPKEQQIFDPYERKIKELYYGSHIDFDLTGWSSDDEDENDDSDKAAALKPPTTTRLKNPFNHSHYRPDRTPLPRQPSQFQIQRAFTTLIEPTLVHFCRWVPMISSHNLPDTLSAISDYYNYNAIPLPQMPYQVEKTRLEDKLDGINVELDRVLSTWSNDARNPTETTGSINLATLEKLYTRRTELMTKLGLISTKLASIQTPFYLSRPFLTPYNDPTQSNNPHVGIIYLPSAAHVDLANVNIQTDDILDIIGKEKLIHHYLTHPSVVGMGLHDATIYPQTAQSFDSSQPEVINSDDGSGGPRDPLNQPFKNDPNQSRPHNAITALFNPLTGSNSMNLIEKAPLDTSTSYQLLSPQTERAFYDALDQLHPTHHNALSPLLPKPTYSGTHLPTQDDLYKFSTAYPTVISSSLFSILSSTDLGVLYHWLAKLSSSSHGGGSTSSGGSGNPYHPIQLTSFALHSTLSEPGPQKKDPTPPQHSGSIPISSITNLDSIYQFTEPFQFRFKPVYNNDLIMNETAYGAYNNNNTNGNANGGGNTITLQQQRHWSFEEDLRLILSVKAHTRQRIQHNDVDNLDQTNDHTSQNNVNSTVQLETTISWQDVAIHVPTRDAYQCRYRYLFILTKYTPSHQQKWGSNLKGL